MLVPNLGAKCQKEHSLAAEGEDELVMVLGCGHVLVMVLVVRLGHVLLSHDVRLCLA